MALIVENGGGVANANSYASVTQADGYWSVRPAGAAWMALATGAKEAALMDATDYVASRLRGSTPLGNALPWPWADVPVDAYTMGVVTKATILAADVARLGPLLGGAAQGGRVLSESKTLGPLSKSTTYSDLSRASSANGRDLSFIDDMLSPIGGGGGGMIIGMRARA